ncbi:hypothetical protein FA15DRAFT_664594 [Coprinopsis marcescibilis]|uniref:Wax synthase domain-containing protein n=1 Tax=Coprinopsis marcescibilis TaxID=230819 RepID=A0A5C3L8I3_COPMA|nr:hypothetical protein FA15DRAFT_664594 [Coprinopsis marcescibilis]
MSLFVVLAYAISSSSSTQATPVPRDSSVHGFVDEPLLSLSPGYPHLDLFLTRTILTSLFTILGCLWVSVHPNAPSPHDSTWSKLLGRIELVLWALVVPELVVCWSVRQWIGARTLKERYRAFGWTMAHAHFLQMGGYTLVRPWPSAADGTVLKKSAASNPPATRLTTIDPVFDPAFVPSQVISPSLLDKLLAIPEARNHIVRIVTPPLHHIRAHSSSDILVSSFAVLQIIWYIAQTIAKAAVTRLEANIHARVLRLEIITIAYIVMSLMMYVLWWDKPMDVRVLRAVDVTIMGDEMVKEQWRVIGNFRTPTGPDEKEEMVGDGRDEVEEMSIPRVEEQNADTVGEDPLDESFQTTLNDTMDFETQSQLETMPAKGASSPLRPISPLSRSPSIPKPVHDRQFASGSTSRLSTSTDPQDSEGRQVEPSPITERPSNSLKSLSLKTSQLSFESRIKKSSSVPMFSRPSSPSPSFLTATNIQHNEIQEVPRSRSPSADRILNSAFFEHPSGQVNQRHAASLDALPLPPAGGGSSSVLFVPSLPMSRSAPPVARHRHEDASCHRPSFSADLGFQERRRRRGGWTGETSTNQTRSPSRNTGTTSVPGFSAESTVFETIWDSVRKSYFAKWFGIDWFLRRCGDIMLGEWGKKGHTSAVHEQDRRTGKLWMPPMQLVLLVGNDVNWEYGGVHGPFGDTKVQWDQRVEKMRKKVRKLRDRIPTFYAMASANVHDDRFIKIFAGGLAVLFGALHVAGWNLSWELPLALSLPDSGSSPTRTVFTILWRVSALTCVVAPIFASFALLRLSEEHDGPSEMGIHYMILEMMVFPVTLLYIPARLLLVVLSFAELVRIGEKWHGVMELGGPLIGEWGEIGPLRWTRLIPHLQ